MEASYFVIVFIVISVETASHFIVTFIKILYLDRVLEKYGNDFSALLMNVSND